MKIGEYINAYSAAASDKTAKDKIVSDLTGQLQAATQASSDANAALATKLTALAGALAHTGPVIDPGVGQHMLYEAVDAARIKITPVSNLDVEVPDPTTPAQPA